MKEATRKKTLIILICLALLGSIIFVGAMGILRFNEIPEDVMTQLYDSYKTSTEKANAANASGEAVEIQTLEEFNTTIETNVKVFFAIAVFRLIVQIVLLVSSIKGPTKNRLALIHLSIFNFILSLSLIGLLILIFSSVKSKDVQYIKPVAPEVPVVNTFKFPVYLIFFLLIWILMYNGVLGMIVPGLPGFALEHPVLLEIIMDSIVLLCVIILLRKELVRDIKLLIKNYGIYHNIITRDYFWLLVLNYASGIILFMITNSTSNNQAVLGELPGWFLIIFAVIIAPFIEEGVYRGILGKVIKNRVAFVIISALLFAAMHVVRIAERPEDPMQYLFLIQYVVMGLILANNYSKTKNLFTSVIMHTLMNAVATTLMLSIA